MDLLEENKEEHLGFEDEIPKQNNGRADKILATEQMIDLEGSSFSNNF
jgi:hypothetical protein